MTSASVGGPMGIYDHDRRARQQQHPFAAAWGPDPPFRLDAARSPPGGGTGAAFVGKAEEEEAPSSDSFGQEPDEAAPGDKALRRLAQNREAARKSRLRKKAYIQTLESSKVKLARLEQELTRVRRHRQGVFAGGESAAMARLPLPPVPAPIVDPGAAALEQDYARWVEEQARHAGELRVALHPSGAAAAGDGDAQLLALVDAGLAHYDALFRLKSRAARRDAFAVLSGAWRAPAERFFLWMGGFRPSDVLAALAPHLADPPLADAQDAAVRALRHTARQLEDALAQGLDRLQQTLGEALLLDAGCAAAAEKLAGLPGFLEQADHLRQQTLRNMRKILTPRQAARGMLALADYCHRLRALSSLWAARPA